MKPKKEIIKRPKGMHDILPEDFLYLDKIIEKAREISEFYGFLPIATPHVEHAELFLRPLGETSEVVEKQMYAFKTRGGDYLALRPEGTAPIMRAYDENGMVSWPHPVKLYYFGSFFRHENPQKGRYREFRQFGVEVLGENDPMLDALTIKIFYLILSELGFSAKGGSASGGKNNILVHINTLGDKNCRPAFKKELTNYYKKKFNYLCKDCKRRFKENPLRLLDCKEESCAEIKSGAPKMIDYLCGDCKGHFKVVLEFLDEGQIPYVLDNFLVRGFDYYGKTVFEVFLETMPAGRQGEGEGKQIALGGGGRYDELMSILGGKSLPATGWGMGLERVVSEMKKIGITSKNHQTPKVFLVQIGPAAKKKSFTLVEELRKHGIEIAESLSKDNFRAQLKIASKVGVKVALIIGQKEAMDGTIIVRNMEDETQEMVTHDKLIEKVKSLLKKKK